MILSIDLYLLLLSRRGCCPRCVDQMIFDVVWINQMKVVAVLQLESVVMMRFSFVLVVFIEIEVNLFVALL